MASHFTKDFNVACYTRMSIFGCPSKPFPGIFEEIDEKSQA